MPARQLVVAFETLFDAIRTSEQRDAIVHCVPFNGYLLQGLFQVELRNFWKLAASKTCWPCPRGGQVRLGQTRHLHRGPPLPLGLDSCATRDVGVRRHLSLPATLSQL